VSLLFGLELPVTDRRPGDDAAMLAAMGLVRLYKLKDRNSAYNNALLRAILILEFMLLHSKYNYEALLILVRLYMFYGAGSLAMERYSRLSIKHMQHASLSWILYTRISTIHPYPSTIPTVDSKGVMTIDPLEDLFRALKWHQGTQDLNFKLIHTMQDQGQWNMILDTVKFEKDLSSSFSKSLLMAEAKRICRFRAPSQNAEKHPDSKNYISNRRRLLLTIIVRIPPQTNDTRDRSAFPNFEGDLTAFEFILPKIGTSTEINVCFSTRVERASAN